MAKVGDWEVRVNDSPGRAPRRSPLALARHLVRDQRIRFVLIGGINTVVGYALFVIVHLTLGRFIGDLLTLYMSYIPATIIAFVLHRHFTYRVTGTGNVVIDFFRFQSVYVVSLIINSVALVLLVQVAKLPTLVAQALIVIVTTLVSYFGHKFFSFRRPGGPMVSGESPAPDDGDETIEIDGDEGDAAEPEQNDGRRRVNRASPSRPQSGGPMEAVIAI
jgi:putative flippase GtrA